MHVSSEKTVYETDVIHEKQSESNADDSGNRR
jgi:hypothetical protein